MDICANPGMIPRTSHPFNLDILVYMSVLNTELLRHPGLSWVILRHLKATLDNPRNVYVDYPRVIIYGQDIRSSMHTKLKKELQQNSAHSPR